MSYTQYKKYSNLFNRINNELDGNRYYTPSEIQENKKTFINAIEYKNYNEIMWYVRELKDCYPCNNDLIKDLNNIVYKLICC